MALEDDGLLLVEAEHVHLSLGSPIAVDLLLIRRHVTHEFLLIGLELAHHLERVRRPSLLFLNHNEVYVTPLISIKVVSQVVTHLVGTVGVDHHIDVEDAV